MAALPRPGLKAIEVASALVLVSFALHGILPDGARVSWIFDYPVYYSLVSIAVLLAWSRVALVSANRAGWTFMALAITSYAAAEFVWLSLYTKDPDPPYPSPADALYLGFYPAAYVGLLLLFRSRMRNLTAGVWIDGLTAALAVATLGSAIVLEAVLDTTGGALATVATNIAYPLGDVLVLALVVAVFSLSGWRPGRDWLLIGLALAVFAVGDSLYLYTTAAGTYVEGGLLDAFWPSALLLLGLAGWYESAPRRVLDTAGRPLLAVPAVCGAVCVAVLVVDHWRRVNLLAVVLATLALTAILVRLALAFRENRRLLEATTREAVTDPVTGLGNRRHFMRALEETLAGPGDEQWLLVIFDLDGFKGYNDAFGHLAGDALLARLGAKLDGIGPGGAYRLGGDEFCLLVPLRDADAETFIDAALAALHERGEGFNVTSSFGAVVLPDESRVARDALRLADERLYAQKHSKRSRRDRPHEALMQAIYEREPALHGHVNDVAELAHTAGARLGLSRGELEQLHRAALLHDVGKIAIPDEIVRKPGPLTEDEWSFVRRHTLVGERILTASPVLRPVARIVRSTHERWDGDGYPDGLAAADIPHAARIIGVCDAFHAMTSPRPYRETLTVEEALEELDRCAGSQFDPEVVGCVVGLVKSRSAAAA